MEWMDLNPSMSFEYGWVRMDMYTCGFGGYGWIWIWIRVRIWIRVGTDGYMDGLANASI